MSENKKKALFDGIDEDLKKKFKKYHLENPQVFSTFADLAKKNESNRQKKILSMDHYKQNEMG